MQLYRIHWKSLVTGMTGQGPGSYAKDEAQKLADRMNEAEKGRHLHWIEPTEGETHHDGIESQVQSSDR